LIQKEIFPWFFEPVIYNRPHLAYNPTFFIRNLIKKIQQLPKGQSNFIVIHLCSNHHPYTTPYPYARDKNLEFNPEKTLRMADGQFGLLLAYLKKAGLYSKSLIILLSDHGSGWDPKNMKLTHGSNFDYPWANRMVLAFHFPFKTNYPYKINNLVRSIDIYPTVLEYLRITPPSNIDGKSLFPLLENKKFKSVNFFAESGYSFQAEFGDYDTNLDHKMVQTEIKKFKVNPITGELYIRDQDYQDLIEKKWYMLIQDSKRLVYNPFLGIMKANRINPETGNDITPLKEISDSGFSPSEISELKNKIIKHFQLSN